jgi:NAD(P)-dependent dehydrogenase (short-subunit alcohol dehydrogenase family)
MKLVLADVDDAALNAAAQEFTAAGCEVLTRHTDVSKAEEVQALADAAVARFGAVHILCNNAGVGGFQRFGLTSAVTWDWILGVNLWGPIHGCRIFLPILEQLDEAHIVNTASVAAVYQMPYHHPYNVSKAGVVALSEGLWREFAAEKPHIGVSVLLPAQVATTIANDERNAPAGHQRRSEADPGLEELRQFVNAGLDVGKSPAEVAELVLRAIQDRRLHIFTHPEWLAVVQQRADDIVAGAPLRDISATTFNPL